MSNTYDHYGSMTWQEFEKFVIHLLNCIYAPDGLRVRKTPYQSDGGKDGYGSLSVKKDIGRDISFFMQLWVEVKKRSSSNVDIDDLGGHIILAIENPDKKNKAEKVNKIMFVTNRKFTDRAKKLCNQIGNRLNLSVAFIDGNRLYELECKYIKNDEHHFSASVLNELQASSSKYKKNSTSNLTLRCGFSAALDTPLDDIDVDMQIDSGEIAYWICEIKGRSHEAIIDIEAILTDINLNCVFLTDNKLQIDNIESHQRITAAVWSDQNICLSSTFIRVNISTKELKAPTIIHGSGLLNVRPTILNSLIPKSRQEVIESAKKEYLRISENSGVSCFLIEAIAGAGKSFLLQRLRHEFLGRCEREVYLDGAVDTRIECVVQSILQQTFPLPIELALTIDEDVLKIWLDQASHSDYDKQAVSSLSKLFANGSVLGREQEVVELIASVLINASIINPVVIIFEDLHKVNSAIYDFIQRLSGVLASRRRGRVFIILTTRPREIRKDNENKSDVLQDFGSSKARLEFHRITALTRTEARLLLTQSLRGLANIEADLIIDQVGTNPFELREALLFLRTDGTVDLSPDQLFYLANPEGIRNAAKAGILLTATQRRLRWFAKQTEEWFNQFILAGACLGKQFVISNALSGLPKPEDSDLERLINLCFDYNVLSPIRMGSNHDGFDIAFDHDLIRNAILVEAGEKKIKFTAGQLLTTLNLTAVNRRKALLEYLAGAGESCMETAEGLLRIAKTNKIHSEAIQYAFLKVSILIATGGFENKADFLLPQLEKIDEALRFVDIPELLIRPSSKLIIEGLKDLLLEMEQVGMLENEIGEILITLAQIHAGYIADDLARSEFSYFDGRRLFGMNRYGEAYKKFLEAEKIWPNGSESRAPELSRVRLRQAICERHLGNLDAARKTMQRALRFRCRTEKADWKLFQSVVANLGAFYMYLNQEQAANYWSKGLRVARLNNHVDGTAHFLNDLAHISLMKRCYEEALTTISQAERVIEEHGLRKEQLRSNILRACIFLCLGRLSPAHMALSQAEDLALAHGDLRRLWRVRANLATWAELMDCPEDAVIYDLQALIHMPIRTEFDGTGTIGERGNRVTGALMNIVHRFNLMPERYMTVRDKIDVQVWQSMLALYETLTTMKEPIVFAGGIGCLYQPVGNEHVSRFLITE